MTTSSEDVLLQVNQVRYKKGDGTLYVMNERVAWMMDHRDTVSVSHKYADIKMQKISPEGKSKIQLQVVLHDGSASTFQFTNRLGAAAQMKDRDDVKELLVQLLPKFKRKVDKELEEKNRLLSENPALLQLYRDLVITQVVTSQEFWSEHACKHTSQLNIQRQDIGVNGAFLADIKPVTDGCNGLKYNLTSDVIESIFKTYPAVKHKHMEFVPHKLSEPEFWTKFFQSHYYHRDRIHTGTKDLFTECAKLDDEELRGELLQGVRDPLLNITSFQDNTIDEGYGLASNSSSGNIVHQNMIKRFNQHSIMVLKAGARTDTPYVHSDGMVAVTGSNTATSGKQEDDAGDEREVKRSRMQEKIMYDDLSEGSSERNNTGRSGLALSKVERYLHGPVTSVASEPPGDMMQVASRFCREADLWSNTKKPVIPPLVSPAMAVSALGELTPGGALMKGYQEHSLGQLVPRETEKELLHIYTALCELLRHFWSCFPPTTKLLEEKAAHMHGALQRFELAKVKPFEDKILREHSPLAQQLTGHVAQLLQLAYSKHTAWRQRLHR